MSNLTQCQEAALENFLEFLGDSSQYFVLTGAAGTGKSYLTVQLLEAHKKYTDIQKALDPDNTAQPRVYLTATTNKAAAVLQGLMENVTSVDVGKITTIHSFLGLTVKKDFKTGAMLLAQKPNFVPDSTQLLIIDEASMIGAALWGFIRTYGSKFSKTKIVFIGDPYQLTPVREAASPAFSLKTSHLRTTVRQALESPLHAYSSQFRQLLEKGMEERKWPTPDTVELLSSDDWWRDLLPNIAADPENARVLTWSNARAVEAGNYIRKYLGKGAEFEEGEYVSLNTPCPDGVDLNPPWIDRHKPYIHKTNRSDAFFGDQELRLGPIEEHTYTLPVSDSEPVVLKLRSSITGNGKHLVYFPESERELMKQLLKHTAAQKMWMLYFWLKDIGDLRTAYAQTIHKSQGSTYNTAYIDLDDVGKCRNWVDTARLMYVGATRPTSRLVLTGELPVYAWTDVSGNRG